MAETIKIGGELESMATGKVVAAASAIMDKSRNKTQEAINRDVEAAISEQSSLFEALSEETSAAFESARQAEQYLADLQEAITDLPDGQAVSAQVAISQADISALEERATKSERDITGVYLTNDMLYLGYTSSDKWKSGAAPQGARYFYVILIEPGCEIRMVKQYSSSDYARYLLISSWATPFNNVAIDYATGYSGVVNMTSSDTTITAPEDAHYLVIFKQFSISSGIVNSMVTGLWIDDVNYLGTGLNGAVENLQAKSQVLEMDMGDKENINENITNRDSVVTALNSVFAAIPKTGAQIPYVGDIPADNMQSAMDVINQQYTDITRAYSALNSGKFYGYYASSNLLPDSGVDGYAYVGTNSNYVIWNRLDDTWSESQSTINEAVGINEVTPEMYGAVGDGETDDTAAFQNAILSGLPIRMTKTYVIKSGIELKNDLRGGGTLLFGVNNISVYASSNITISNITFDGNSKMLYLLYLQQLNDVVVENCIFRNVGTTDTSRQAGNGMLMLKGCRNIVVKSCTFNGCYTASNGGAASMVNITNNNTTGNNKYIIFDSCYFNDVKGKDADCLKTIGGNVECYIKVTNCLFTEFQKRALKFQGQQCASVNNTFIISYPCYCVIDFQRGYGLSLGDTMILDYNSEGIEDDDTEIDDEDSEGQTTTKTLAYKCISMSHGYCTVSSLRVINRNGSTNKSQALFTFQNFSAYHSENAIENVYINNVMAEGLSFLLVNTSQMVECRNIRMTDIYYKANARNQAFSIKNAIMKNCVIDGATTNITNLNIVKYGTTGSFVGCDIRLRHEYSTLNIIGSNNTVKSINRANVASTFDIDYNGRKTFYLTDSVNPSNKTSSGYHAMFSCAVGTLAYIPEPVYDDVSNKVKVGYICTVAGTSEQSGTFTEYYI